MRMVLTGSRHVNAGNSVKKQRSRVEPGCFFRLTFIAGAVPGVHRIDLTPAVSHMPDRVN
jgi:hypothetical protein